MPAPTIYTESSLKTFMVEVLDSVATDLGLTASSTAISQAVIAVERLLGVDDVQDLTDMPVLEAAATWKAWAVALGVATTKYDLKAGSADLKRSQMFDGLQKKVMDSEAVYYSALVASGGSSTFAFATICGRRGR